MTRLLSEEDLTQVTLEFSGPFAWWDAPDGESVYSAGEAEHPGIYLWTIPFDNGHLIHYVGATGRPFTVRLHEHLREFLSGGSRIYEPAPFARGEKQLVWNAINFWSVAERNRVPALLEQFGELAPKIRDLARLMRFFLARLDGKSRTRKRAESMIASSIRRREGVVGEFLEDDGHYEDPQWPGEAELALTISTHRKLHGLPEALKG